MTYCFLKFYSKFSFFLSSLALKLSSRQFEKKFSAVKKLSYYSFSTALAEVEKKNLIFELKLRKAVQYYSLWKNEWN